MSSFYELIEVPESEENKRPLETLKGIVYCIHNKITGHKYIGKTVRTFFKRYVAGKWWKHTQNKLLKQDYEKYGIQAFEISILEQDKSNEDLLFLEAEYIYNYNTFVPNGYNLSYDTDPLGKSESGLFYVARLSQEKIYVFQKCALDNKVKFYTGPHKGIPCSLEKKNKISKANKGSKRSDADRKRMSHIAKTRVISPEEKSRRVQAMRGINSKKVEQFNPTTNQVFREFDSARDAAKYFNLKSVSGISLACHDSSRTARGFHLRYKL